MFETLDKSCKLKSLELSDVNLRETLARLLARVVNKIERVVLKDMEIEAFHIENIFLAIIGADSVMKHFVLDILDDGDIFSELDVEVFAKAVNKLESVNFDRMLSDDQSKIIFKMMSMETNLASIPNYYDNDDRAEYECLGFDNVDPGVLDRALNNLKFVKIDFESLTFPQMFAFFNQLNSKTKLENIVSGEKQIKVEDVSKMFK